MNKLNKLVIFIAIFTTNTVVANKSIEPKHFKDMKKVSLKCFVELVNGKNSIFYYHDLLVENRSGFEERLMNGVLQLKRDPKRDIFKVKQCVDMKRRFKEPEANRLVLQDNSQG